MKLSSSFSAVNANPSTSRNAEVSRTPSPAPGGRIQSREIMEHDLDEVAAMLGKGLGYRKTYFAKLFGRLKTHPTPAGFPRYGYVLVYNEAIVGAIVLIFTRLQKGDASEVRCHVTSWFVQADYRAYATVFFNHALKNKTIGYLNTSARPATLPIVRQQGFSKYSRGQFVTLPLLNFLTPSTRDRVQIVRADAIPDGQFEPFERDLLLAHASYGNLAFWCSTSGSAYPFVFQRRLFKGILPGAQLVYCRKVEDFVRFASSIGWTLAARGIFIVRIDSNGEIPGILGKFFDGVEPRYFKGIRPRLGDLAYTQNVITGHVRKPWTRVGFRDLIGYFRNWQ